MQSPMSFQRSQVPPGRAPGVSPRMAASAPVSFWEWFCTVYPPMHFIYNEQFYFVTISPAASAASTTGNLSIQVPIFAFGFRGRVWSTYDGQPPTFPVRAGIALLSGNDWTFGQWDPAVLTGTNGTFSTDYRFEWPREVPASTQLTITINNTLNSQALTGDWGIFGLEPRRRDQPLTQAMLQDAR